MTCVVPARRVEPGLLPLLREAAVPLALFSGVAHGGAAVLVGLMVARAVSGGAGGTLLLLWSAFSLFVSLVGYRRMEERRRREAASELAASGMRRLASGVVALYPRPVEDPTVAEVFELYRRAQASLEEGDYRGAGEAIERGVALADGLLAGEVGGSGREVVMEPGVLARDEEAKGRGAESWS